MDSSVLSYCCLGKRGDNALLLDSRGSRALVAFYGVKLAIRGATLLKRDRKRIKSGD